MLNIQRFAVLAVLIVVAPNSAFGQINQNPYEATNDFTGASLDLRLYSDPGSDQRLNSISSQPLNTGNNNIFLTTQEGRVFEIADNGAGQGVSTQFFDYDAAVTERFGAAATDGFTTSGPNGQNGLQGIAFHPEFATNGKFYTSALVDSPSDRSGLNYLGSSVAGRATTEGVVAEWTFDSNANQVQSSSYRELFRVQTPEDDHPLKLPQFDPFARPGDEAYGLLYVAHGDGDSQSQGGVGIDGGQNLTNALGKVLRINPLEDTVNNTPFSVPSTNPFFGNANALDEIYTSGHRNPHTFSFAQDENGDSRIIVGEISFENIEEINVLQAGGDYGWNEREGTYVSTGSGFGLGNGTEPLPENEADLNDYVYPAAQYAHVQGTRSAQAVAGGFVVDIEGDVSLEDQYFFADFSFTSGALYTTALDELLGANTQLTGDETPEDLTQAIVNKLRIRVDLDGDGILDTSANNLAAALGLGNEDPEAEIINTRNDIRFGIGPNGELFVTSKRNGNVYIATNAVSSQIASITAVPELGTGLLLAMGLTGIAAVRRRSL